MTVVFISNFFNHHQKPLADAMYALLGEGYHFIETKPMSEERLKMGWGLDVKPAYVKQTYTGAAQKAEVQSLINDADVAILGSAPHTLVAPRLQAGKITFKCSERKYKDGCPYLKLPHHFLINRKKYIRYKSMYLLCASAFASADYAKTFTFRNRAYKWAYFTALKEYDNVEKLIEVKHPASILWVARFIDVKHPEAPIEVAKRLKADGYSFEMNLIGNGELEDRIRALIAEYGLEDYVHMLGSMKPDQVREHMEKSEIFLFTSDKGEGWGAVLNESMNSACAVVASHAIGSVPFLIQSGENGLIYRDGDLDDLTRKVKQLLDHPDECRKIGFAAYETMKNEWNAENAARRFIELAQKLLDGEKHPFPFDTGVCSRAERLKDNWIKNLKRR